MQPPSNYGTVVNIEQGSVEDARPEQRVRNYIEDVFLCVAQLSFFVCRVGSFANGDAWKGAGSVVGLGVAFVVHDCLSRTR